MCMQADATGTIVKFLTPNGAPVTVGQVGSPLPNTYAKPRDLQELLAILQKYISRSRFQIPSDTLMTWLQALALIKP